MTYQSHIECPQCAAFPGKPCLSQSGRPLTKPHKIRLLAARRATAQKLKALDDPQLVATVTHGKTSV